MTHDILGGLWKVDAPAIGKLSLPLAPREGRESSRQRVLRYQVHLM